MAHLRPSAEPKRDKKRGWYVSVWFDAATGERKRRRLYRGIRSQAGAVDDIVGALPPLYHVPKQAAAVRLEHDAAVKA